MLFRSPDPKDGCPDKDTDKDGVPVPEDKCPDKPETANGFEDEDGCPDEKPLVQLKETEVQINQKIQFGKDKATIEPSSNMVIEAVAKLVKQNPELNLIEIGGHASKEGNEQHNLQLTQQRVDAVMAALAKQGVEKNRMVAQGYGSYCPVDGGESEEALEKNRRVEFHILYRKGKDLGQKRGCENATKKNIKMKPLPAVKTVVAEEQKAAEKAAPKGPEKGAPKAPEKAAPKAPEPPAPKAAPKAPEPAMKAAPAGSAAPK